jgi:large subunit ribosomal protein L21
MNSVSERELGLEVVYAIVRAGGRQEKVEVGTVLVVDRQKTAEDGTLTFAPVLLVDGEKVTHAAADLAKITVTAELVNNERGKKIIIQKFKNKTGYKKRQGHRQDLSRVRITAIG